jgi:hypothetical protein
VALVGVERLRPDYERSMSERSEGIF